MKPQTTPKVSARRKRQSPWNVIINGVQPTDDHQDILKSKTGSDNTQLTKYGQITTVDSYYGQGNINARPAEFPQMEIFIFYEPAMIVARVRLDNQTTIHYIMYNPEEGDWPHDDDEFLDRNQSNNNAESNSGDQCNNKSSTDEENQSHKYCIMYNPEDGNLPEDDYDEFHNGNQSNNNNIDSNNENQCNNNSSTDEQNQSQNNSGFYGQSELCHRVCFFCRKAVMVEKTTFKGNFIQYLRLVRRLGRCKCTFDVLSPRNPDSVRDDKNYTLSWESILQPIRWVLHLVRFKCFDDHDADVVKSSTHAESGQSDIYTPPPVYGKGAVENVQEEQDKKVTISHCHQGNSFQQSEDEEQNICVEDTKVDVSSRPKKKRKRCRKIKNRKKDQVIMDKECQVEERYNGPSSICEAGDKKRDMKHCKMKKTRRVADKKHIDFESRYKNKQISKNLFKPSHEEKQYECGTKSSSLRRTPIADKEPQAQHMMKNVCSVENQDKQQPPSEDIMRDQISTGAYETIQKDHTPVTITSVSLPESKETRAKKQKRPLKKRKKKLEHTTVAKEDSHEKKEKVTEKKKKEHNYNQPGNMADTTVILRRREGMNDNENPKKNAINAATEHQTDPSLHKKDHLSVFQEICNVPGLSASEGTSPGEKKTNMQHSASEDVTRGTRIAGAPEAIQGDQMADKNISQSPSENKETRAMKQQRLREKQKKRIAIREAKEKEKRRQKATQNEEKKEDIPIEKLASQATKVKENVVSIKKESMRKSTERTDIKEDKQKENLISPGTKDAQEVTERGEKQIKKKKIKHMKDIGTHDVIRKEGISSSKESKGQEEQLQAPQIKEDMTQGKSGNDTTDTHEERKLASPDHRHLHQDKPEKSEKISLPPKCQSKKVKPGSQSPDTCEVTRSNDIEMDAKHVSTNLTVQGKHQQVSRTSSELSSKSVTLSQNAGQELESSGLPQISPVSDNTDEARENKFKGAADGIQGNDEADGVSPLEETRTIKQGRLCEKQKRKLAMDKEKRKQDVSHKHMKEVIQDEELNIETSEKSNTSPAAKQCLQSTSQEEPGRSQPDKDLAASQERIAGTRDSYPSPVVLKHQQQQDHNSKSPPSDVQKMTAEPVISRNTTPTDTNQSISKNNQNLMENKDTTVVTKCLVRPESPGDTNTVSEVPDVIKSTIHALPEEKTKPGDPIGNTICQEPDIQEINDYGTPEAVIEPTAPLLKTWDSANEDVFDDVLDLVTDVNRERSPSPPNPIVEQLKRLQEKDDYNDWVPFDIKKKISGVDTSSQKSENIESFLSCDGKATSEDSNQTEPLLFTETITDDGNVGRSPYAPKPLNVEPMQHQDADSDYKSNEVDVLKSASEESCTDMTESSVKSSSSSSSNLTSDTDCSEANDQLPKVNHNFSQEWKNLSKAGDMQRETNDSISKTPTGMNKEDGSLLCQKEILPDMTKKEIKEVKQWNKKVIEKERGIIKRYFLDKGRENLDQSLEEVRQKEEETEWRKGKKTISKWDATTNFLGNACLGAYKKLPGVSQNKKERFENTLLLYKVRRKEQRIARNERKKVEQSPGSPITKTADLPELSYPSSNSANVSSDTEDSQVRINQNLTKEGDQSQKLSTPLEQMTNITKTGPPCQEPSTEMNNEHEEAPSTGSHQPEDDNAEILEETSREKETQNLQTTSYSDIEGETYFDESKVDSIPTEDTQVTDTKSEWKKTLLSIFDEPEDIGLHRSPSPQTSVIDELKLPSKDDSKDMNFFDIDKMLDEKYPLKSESEESYAEILSPVPKQCISETSSGISIVPAKKDISNEKEVPDATSEWQKTLLSIFDDPDDISTDRSTFQQTSVNEKLQLHGKDEYKDRKLKGGNSLRPVCIKSAWCEQMDSITDEATEWQKPSIGISDEAVDGRIERIESPPKLIMKGGENTMKPMHMQIKSAWGDTNDWTSDTEPASLQQPLGISDKQSQQAETDFEDKSGQKKLEKITDEMTEEEVKKAEFVNRKIIKHKNRPIQKKHDLNEKTKEMEYTLQSVKKREEETEWRKGAKKVSIFDRTASIVENNLPTVLSPIMTGNKKTRLEHKLLASKVKRKEQRMARNERKKTDVPTTVEDCLEEEVPLLEYTPDMSKKQIKEIEKCNILRTKCQNEKKKAFQKALKKEEKNKELNMKYHKAKEEDEEMTTDGKKYKTSVMKSTKHWMQKRLLKGGQYFAPSKAAADKLEKKRKELTVHAVEKRKAKKFFENIFQADKEFVDDKWISIDQIRQQYHESRVLRSLGLKPEFYYPDDLDELMHGKNKINKKEFKLYQKKATGYDQSAHLDVADLNEHEKELRKSYQEAYKNELMEMFPDLESDTDETTSGNEDDDSEIDNMASDCEEEGNEMDEVVPITTLDLQESDNDDEYVQANLQRIDTTSLLQAAAQAPPFGGVC